MNVTDIKKRKVKGDSISIANYSGVNKLLEPALFYGFMAIKTPTVSQEDVKQGKEISEGNIINDEQAHEGNLWVKLPEKVSIIRTYVEKNLSTLSQPVMLAYERNTPKAKNLHFGLDIIGAPTSVAEALLIQSAYSILTEAGHSDLRIEINSIGDKGSVQRFTKEFSLFYRKNINLLPASCRQAMKKDLFCMLSCVHDTCKNLASECPKSVNFLSEPSREHFKEVIEYLEASDMPYVINNSLVANRDYCTETIFEIRDEKTSESLAVGCRYDGLGKKLGIKKDLAAVGVSIVIKKHSKSPKLAMKTVQGIMNPNISYIQLGFEAKLKSLGIMESLRKIKIPVIHSLAKDKIGSQIASAEKNDTRFLIIVGKKEALENSVIVRDKSTRSQISVSLNDLPFYLKKIKA